MTRARYPAYRIAAWRADDGIVIGRIGHHAADWLPAHRDPAVVQRFAARPKYPGVVLAVT